MEWEREFWHISFLTTAMRTKSKTWNFAHAAPVITAATVVGFGFYFTFDIFDWVLVRCKLILSAYVAHKIFSV